MSGLSGAVPKHATYTTGGLPVGLDSKRRTVRMIPQTGLDGYTPTGTNIIRIDIPPSLGFLDTQNSYLRFRIKVDGTVIDVSKPCFMDRSAMSWCDRFEVISNNGSVLESIHDYNLLVNLLHKSTSPDDYRLTAGKLLDNQGSRPERMGNVALSQGRQYCVGLDASGIFGGNTKYLPCQFIQGSLTLEFTLATFADCFVGSPLASVSQGSYTIDSVEYIAECITFGQDYNYIFEQQLRSQGIDMHFHSYRSHHHSLQSGTTQVIQLSQNSKSVKGVYCVIRDKARYRSQNHESLSTYKSGRLVDYQFDLGGRLFPEFPINVKSAGEASCYANNLNSYNHFRDHNGGAEITRETFCPHLASSNHKIASGGTYTANTQVTARFHGYLVGNSVADAKGLKGSSTTDGTLVTEGGLGTDLTVNSTTIFFRPSNLMDARELRIGDRVRLNIRKAVVKATDTALQPFTAESADYADTNDSADANFLYVVGIGLDVVMRADDSSKKIFTTLRGCVALAKAKSGKASEAYGGDGYMAEEVVGGFASAGVLTKTGAITPFSAGHDFECFLDRIPNDEDFYIGQSFESHEEHDTLISGTDLTNTVPLHINMKFEDSTTVNALAPVKQGDLLTSFLHYDAVLRVEPDGSCISSM